MPPSTAALEKARALRPPRRALAIAVGLLLAACNSVLGIEEAESISEDQDLSDDQEERAGFGLEPISGSPSSGQTSASCGPNAKFCLGECVAVSDPRFGCTTECAPACALPYAKAVCRDDACAILECKSGWTDCNGDPADGCEADTWEPQNCGGCGNVCEGDTPYCDHGICSAEPPAE